MVAQISGSKLSGAVRVPPSKSWMQRVCAAALLHHGETIIRNYGQSADDKAAVEIIIALGAEVKVIGDTLHIRSSGIVSPQHPTISCGESGLSARLFIPMVSLSEKAITITGGGSLLSRPMDGVLDLLPQLGVQVSSEYGRLPVQLKGPLLPKNVEVDGSMSSQFLSGLLFALSTSATEPITIQVRNLVSKPYVDMTIDVLHSFGHDVSHEQYERFTITPAKKLVGAIDITIPADWSSGAYWLVGTAIAGEDVRLKGLQTGTHQADELVLEVLRRAGATVNEEDDCLQMTSTNLNAFEADLTDAPDLFPILAVLAACCKEKSTLIGLERLAHKESNREKSVQDMLTVLGVFYKTENNRLIIEGRNSLKSGTIQGYNDHRIVMAATIAALKADNGLTITDAEAVAKSYPDFFQDAATLGMKCNFAL